MFNSKGVILGRHLWNCEVEGLELMEFGVWELRTYGVWGFGSTTAV